MELKEQVERIKEILPDCTEREIYLALKHCKMDPDEAVQRLLSRVETEKNREKVPMEGKEKVERIKKMVPRFAEEYIYEMLKQCNMDSDLAIQRLLSQVKKGKNIEGSPMEWKEQVEHIKATKEDREGVLMQLKEQVERTKEMMPCFTEDLIYKMREQCHIDSDLTMPKLLSPELEEQCKFSLMIQSDSSSDDDSSSVQELEEQCKFSLTIQSDSSSDDDSSSVQVAGTHHSEYFKEFLLSGLVGFCDRQRCISYINPFIH